MYLDRNFNKSQNDASHMKLATHVIAAPGSAVIWFVIKTATLYSVEIKSTESD